MPLAKAAGSVALAEDAKPSETERQNHHAPQRGARARSHPPEHGSGTTRQIRPSNSSTMMMITTNPTPPLGA